MQKRKVIPSFLTSMNLMCGFFAILINEPITSFYLVMIGIAFDFVDGFSARALKVPSAFGKELDSLADMVSFGVVPGFLYYHHVLKVDGDDSIIYLTKLIIAGLIPILAGLRLAKFNVKDNGKIGFAGLPSSAAALFIISIPFLAEMNHPLIEKILGIPNLSIILPLPFALLMVTNVPMFNFKSFAAGIKGNIIQLIYPISLIPMVLLFGWATLPLSIFWYIILSVITIPVWRK